MQIVKLNFCNFYSKAKIIKRFIFVCVYAVHSLEWIHTHEAKKGSSNQLKWT